jgi:hypothetical protein
MLYWKLQEPINFLGRGIGKLLGKLWEAMSGSFESNPVREITYK